MLNEFLKLTPLLALLPLEFFITSMREAMDNYEKDPTEDTEEKLFFNASLLLAKRQLKNLDDVGTFKENVTELMEMSDLMNQYKSNLNLDSNEKKD